MRPDTVSAWRPTRRAALVFGAVALATILVPVGVLFPVLAMGVVTGCVMVDLIAASRARPRATRTRPPSLALRVPVPFALGVDAPGARSTRLRQPVPPELGVVPSEAQGRELVGELVGRHRGVHVLAPAVVRATGPLGLASADHSVAGEETVSVLPDLPRARRLAASRRRGRVDQEGRARIRLGIGTEFESIRDYSPDDDVRRINWIATARVGRAMTNQYRTDENRDLLCVVDTGRLMASPVGDLTRLDVALDAVAVLAVAAEDGGDRIGGIAFDTTVTRRLAPRRQGAEPLVRALFDLEPTEVESDYERAFVSIGRHRRALVALFTDLVDESAARSLLAACPMLARRHTLLVVSCRDPDLVAAARGPHRYVHDVLAAGVALQVLASRRRVVALLRSMGVSVVEDEPGRLGPACVTTYLALKARSRI
jgi:uncharacterized protein (DUF58 family)